jgi:hypothetical protein
MITATNEDNMLMMARYPDNYFDLVLVLLIEQTKQVMEQE